MNTSFRYKFTYKYGLHKGNNCRRRFVESIGLLLPFLHQSSVYQIKYIFVVHSRIFYVVLHLYCLFSDIIFTCKYLNSLFEDILCIFASIFMRTFCFVSQLFFFMWTFYVVSHLFLCVHFALFRIQCFSCGHFMQFRIYSFMQTVFVVRIYCFIRTFYVALHLRCIVLCRNFMQFHISIDYLHNRTMFMTCLL